MKTLWIATSNAHKVSEFQAMLSPLGYEVKSLLDLPQAIDVEENGKTFEENALIKARALYEVMHMPIISDDSGLMVNALHGAPGVYSARFMGYDTSYEVKNQMIMDIVKASDDKGAQFVCAIAYIDQDGGEHVFTGIVNGEIATQSIGERGFGYDPIFYYPPYGTTLANVSEAAKNKVSHRSQALAQLIAFLKEEEQ